ncbi:MAG TPA: hypothetical protein VOA87_12040 [Thermoanaerobaculia bacterium]|nr:hypothetical protein [Thermoanaerobaculia bacterium]
MFRRLFLLILLLASRASAAGEPSSLGSKLVFDPPIPTAGEPVAIAVSGTSPVACYAPDLGAQVIANVIRLDLDGFNCPSDPPAPTPTPFSATVRLGPLAAGTYRVQLFVAGKLESTVTLQVRHRLETRPAGFPALPRLGLLALVLVLALVGAKLLQ